MKKMFLMIAAVLCMGTAASQQNNADKVSLETKVYTIKETKIEKAVQSTKKSKSKKVTTQIETRKDTLHIDAYYDKTAPVPAEGRPTMVYIHGGGFTMGDRVNAAQEVFCRYLAERGWLALSVDYRLAGVTTGADGQLQNPYNVDGTLTAIRMACDDVVDAINFVLADKEWKANPNQVCLGGGSAGAFTSLQMVYDRCNDEAYTQKLPQDFKFAGVISQAGAIATQADSLTWKTQPCPVMFFHGDKDNVVPLDKGNLDCNLFGTYYICRQFKTMGVPYWKWIEHGADHVMAMKTLTSYLEEQYRFLNEFCLKGLKTTVNTDVEDAEPAEMSSVEMMCKYVPLYIFGYGKYLKDIDWSNIQKPQNIVF